ncbi:MAG TPA: LppA family lipoprotein [Actinopolymorphaceae bacterium]|jgi:hypothetical protein
MVDDLLERPDIETVHRRCLDMLHDIREALVTELGVRPWDNGVVLANGSTVGGTAAGVGGEAEVRRYHGGVSPGNLPDAQWPRAVDVVSRLARRYGFDNPVVVVDRPGDHEVSFADEYGAELLFGTAANTTLSLATGCHPVASRRDL